MADDSQFLWHETAFLKLYEVIYLKSILEHLNPGHSDDKVKRKMLLLCKAINTKEALSAS